MQEGHGRVEGWSNAVTGFIAVVMKILMEYKGRHYCGRIYEI